MDTLPSLTAYLVADGVLRMADDSRVGRYVPPAAIPYLQMFTDKWRELRAEWLKEPDNHSQLEALLVPVTMGIREHYVMRKRLIEQTVRNAIAAGATNVVNVGAGLDTLCLRLKDEFPQQRFIEVDHPSTQQVKLHSLSADQLAKIEWASADMDEGRLRDMLRSKIKPGSKTVYIMEGLTPYLTPPDVETLFSDIKELSGGNAQIILEVLNGLPQNVAADSPYASIREVQRQLSGQKEGYRYSQLYKDMGEVLRRAGFHLTESYTMGELQDFRPDEERRQIDAQPTSFNYFIATSAEQ